MLYAACPDLPYQKNFNFEIKPGFQVLVTGQCLEDYFPGSQPWGFAVNLHGNHRFDSDIILHFNPRPESKVVVMNSYQGEWGTESEPPPHYPFNNEQAFTIVIQAHSEYFKIFVNGNHFYDYKHRKPLNSITGIKVGAEVIVHQVIISNHEVDKFPPPPVPDNEPIIFHPELPLALNNPEAMTKIAIPGKFQAGMIFAFVGKSPENANKFYINWLTQCGDVAFHFNPRFEADVVVRNTKTGGEWGHDERDHQSPFKLETEFQIFVKVQVSSYQVWVNGSHFCDYQHRIQPLSEVNAIEFVGDVTMERAKITF